MHAPQPVASDIADAAADVLARLRANNPRVHCITNAVAQNFTANVLLAAGAVPSMTVAPEEVGEFVARANALLVNLGTFDRELRAAAEIAVARANESGRPWVLDPVFVERSAPRAAFGKTLLTGKPSVLRLNSVEFASLCGREAEDPALRAVATAAGGVVALTGATDRLTDGARFLRIANGDALMGRVTAMGCAGAALVAACLAVEPDWLIATAAALLAFAVAGELAAARSSGPGSFAIEIIDALHNLDGATLRARAKVSS